MLGVWWLALSSSDSGGFGLIDGGDLWSISMMVVVFIRKVNFFIGNGRYKWCFCVGFDSGDRFINLRWERVNKVKMMLRSGFYGCDDSQNVMEAGEQWQRKP